MITLAQRRQRRRRIISVTLGIARGGGYEAVQMRAVAERAWVSAPSPRPSSSAASSCLQERLLSSIPLPPIVIRPYPTPPLVSTSAGRSPRHADLRRRYPLLSGRE